MSAPADPARKYLRKLIRTSRQVISVLDGAMKGPSTEARGKNIAWATNQLELATDMAARYGLPIRKRKP